MRIPPGISCSRQCCTCCSQAICISAHRLLLFLCSMALSIVAAAPSQHRGLGENSWRKKRQKRRLRAGDEASMRDAGSGHGRTGYLRVSSSHDARMCSANFTVLAEKVGMRVARLVWSASRSLTSELFWSSPQHSRLQSQHSTPPRPAHTTPCTLLNGSRTQSVGHEKLKLQLYLSWRNTTWRIASQSAAKSIA